MSAISTRGSSTHYELRFISLFQAGRCYSFPCDEEGDVDINTLSNRLRDSYFFARRMVGRELTTPQVVPSETTH